MSKFVKILQFHSDQGTYDIVGDTEEVNEALSKLQEKGAQIVEIKGELAGAVSGAGSASHHMIYIVYEAPSPIGVEEDSGGIFGGIF